MKRTEFLPCLLTVTLVFCAGSAWSQDDTVPPDQPQEPDQPIVEEAVLPPEESTADLEQGITETVTVAEEPTYDDYTVKAYTLSVFGGYFSGDTFLSLPPLADRTFVEPGSNDVMGYDGEWLNLDPNIYDAPTKTIESGTGWGTAVGIYLSDAFHLDLSLTFASASATTDMLNSNPQDPENPYVERVDEDSDVKVYTGGVALMYDAHSFRLFGIYPYVGFGLGGVINSFTKLEDKTGFYFRGIGGLKYDISRKFILFGQANLTTFSFPTEELSYTTQVTYFDFYLGLSLFIDVLPADVRAAHELETGS